MDEPISLSELLDEGYDLQGPKEWPLYTGGYLDRTKYVSSSEVGGCSRSIKFGKVSRPLGRDKWGHAERGNLIEAWAIDLIRSAIEEKHFNEWRLMFAGKRQFSFIHGEQSGTPDGALIHLPTETAWCVDVKSVDPRTNFDKLPKRMHQKQVTQNTFLLSQVTPYKMVGGILFYIDASDLQRRKIVPVPFDKDVMDQLTEKARRIMAAKSPEDLEPEGLYSSEDLCKWCGFTNRCNEMIERNKKPTLDMTEMERATKNVF